MTTPCPAWPPCHRWGQRSHRRPNWHTGHSNLKLPWRNSWPFPLILALVPTPLAPTSIEAIQTHHKQRVPRVNPRLASAAHLCREAAEEAEPEVDHGEGEVLVEEVAEELAHAQVGPAPVHQEQALQEFELGEGVVRGQHRLDALLPADPHPDVGGCGEKRRGVGTEHQGPAVTQSDKDRGRRTPQDGARGAPQTHS